MKTCADGKINRTENLKFVWGRIENIVGKGVNASLPAFSPFPTMFSKFFFIKVVKSRDCVLKAFDSQSRLLTTVRKNLFENIVGKGEKCW